MDIKQRILERTTKELPLLVDYEELENEFDFLVEREINSFFSAALKLNGNRPESDYVVSEEKVIEWAAENSLIARLSTEKPDAILFFKI